MNKLNYLKNTNRQTKIIISTVSLVSLSSGIVCGYIYCLVDSLVKHK